ncbi:hypothetical protein ACIPUC_01635 [Streptomyces sp. LARHCF249]
MGPAREVSLVQSSDSYSPAETRLAAHDRLPRGVACARTAARLGHWACRGQSTATRKPPRSDGATPECAARTQEMQHGIEPRIEAESAGDAELIVVAYGTPAACVRAAVREIRPRKRPPRDS